MKDTRPSYRGGGYGFPKIGGYFGSGRRRVYWEQGGLISERAGQTGKRRIAENIEVIPTFVRGVVTGAGIALGIILLNRAIKATR